MNIANLEQKFKETKLFPNHEFLDKYIQLILQNIDTKSEQGKTQKHHIFPKCLSKILNQEIDNTTVNLQYKDHILAHYYLIYATNDNKLKSANIHAFNHLLKYQGHWLDEITLMDLLQKQQVVYEQSRYLRSAHSKEINTGGCYVNNGKKSKHIRLDELDIYLKNGWVRGQIQDHSKMQGTIVINNGVNEKRIYKEQLSTFIATGWKKGKITGYKKTGMTSLGKVCVHSDIENKELRIDKTKLDAFLKLNPQYSIGGKKHGPHKKKNNV